MSPSLRLTAENMAALQASRARVVLVGSSGWLGSAALAMLDQAFPTDELGQRVLVFGSSARQVRLPSGRLLACQPLDNLPDIEVADCQILHFGYLTRDKTVLMSVDDYVRTNEAIQDCVVRAVAARHPRGLFFASSGAVYQGEAEGQPAGSTRVLPTRDTNLYGWMKAKHEAELADATAAAGTAYVSGRIFSLAGEYINKVELYALGSFLAALRANEPIRIQAAREVWRSYAYVGDVVNLALALLLKRETVPCFDIAGAEAIEIGRLAELCAEVTGNAQAPISRPPLTSNTPDRMVGDSSTYYRLMEREGISALPLSEQIRVTAAYLDVR